MLLNRTLLGIYLKYSTEPLVYLWVLTCILVADLVEKHIFNNILRLIDDYMTVKMDYAVDC